MNLFDKYILNIHDLLDDLPSKRFAFSQKLEPSSNTPSFITIKDSKVELGGGNTPSLGFSVQTSSLDFENETLLYGKDLQELSSNVPFVKIVFIKTNDVSSDEQTIYNVIKQLEYLKYNVNVQGFMSRASSLNMREEVRVSKRAVKNGLSFESVGNTLINEYLKHPNVEKVKIVFITGECKRFDQLQQIAKTVQSAQNALNHIFDNVVIDCAHCNLKPICDEVEGMREMHVGLSNASNTAK